VRVRHQEGYVYRKKQNWYLRYREVVQQPDGTSAYVQKCRKLVEYGGDYRTKSAVKVLADEFLAPLNNGSASPQSTMLLTQFVDQLYLPFVKSNKRPSTYAGYRNMWNLYLKDRCEITLREFRTFEGESILNSIVRDFNVSSTTVAHIKAFLSGVFRYAKRQGVINSENPMHDVVLPKARRGGETYAYSLDEINRVLVELPEKPATIVATAAFTGVREGELRGMLWENYSGTQVWITQSVWRGHVQEPKTKASMAPVPVIAELAARIDTYRKSSGSPANGLMFPNSVGKPTCMAKLARDVVRPAFKKAGVAWHGWHAFRRGLATNLHRLGVADKVIQAILRHSNVAVTQSCYIKTVGADVEEAMMSLNRAAAAKKA
jgi:integrase